MNITKKNKKSKQEKFAKKTYAKKYGQMFDQLETQYKNQIEQIYVDVPKEIKILKEESKEIFKELKEELKEPTTKSIEKVDDRTEGKRDIRRDRWKTALFIISFAVALSSGLVVPIVFFDGWIWDKAHKIRFGLAFIPVIILLAILVIYMVRVEQNNKKMYEKKVIPEINQLLSNKKEEG